MALQWHDQFLPLAKGVNTKPDPRALAAPDLAICRDAQFDELGGIQTRKPYAALPGAMEDPRGLAAYGSELILFDKENLYSYSTTEGGWLPRDTHLAITIDETAVFGRNADQSSCDRATLNGVTFYTWTEQSAVGNYIYLAANDATTGAVLLSPRRPEFAGLPATADARSQRPHLVVMDTKVLLFWYQPDYLTNARALKVLALDPANPVTSAAAAPTVLASGANLQAQDTFLAPASYDVATAFDAVAGATTAVLVHASSVAANTYLIHKVSENLTFVTASKARFFYGPVSLAISPDQTRAIIFRINSLFSFVVADSITISTLADFFINIYVGATPAASPSPPASGITTPPPITHIASGWIAGAPNRCYVWWSTGEDRNFTGQLLNTITGLATTQQNWIDGFGSIGVAKTLDNFISLGSRGFSRNGHAYVWLTFAGVSASGALGNIIKGRLQNSYFLLRDDGLILARAVSFNGGGFAGATGHLPNVQHLGGDTFAWAGCQARLIAESRVGTGYRAQQPIDIAFTFDDDAARQTVQFGDTLYIPGGQTLQFDGVALAEVGFNVYPWVLFFTATVHDGAKSAGTYAYKSTFSWVNGKNELDRSTTASYVTIDVAGGQTLGIYCIPNLFPTRKTNPSSEVTLDVWATIVNPPDDAPFYQVTGTNPAATAMPNGYLQNIVGGPTQTFSDNLSDAVTQTKAENPENGNVLESLSAPCAKVIYATQDRLFLANIPGSPNTVAYSRAREVGKAAGFNDTLTFDVPPSPNAEPITAVWTIDETVLVFRESELFALPGSGFDNTSGGTNYGPVRRISGDVGCVTDRSIALTPQGLLFKTGKGWYLLDHGLNLAYVGGAVSAFDGDTVKAAHVMEAQHQVRIVTDQRVLVWDYLVNAWSEWTIAGGLDATVWQGKHVILTDSAVLMESDFQTTATNYGLDVETAWIPFQQLSNFGAVRKLQLLGEWRSDHQWRTRIAYDYAETDAAGPTYDDDKVIANPTAVQAPGSPLRFQVHPKRQKAGAFKIRLTAVGMDGAAPPVGEAAKLTGLGLEVGYKRGLSRRIGAAFKE